jgi:hypothetical protein
MRFSMPVPLNLTFLEDRGPSISHSRSAGLPDLPQNALDDLFPVRQIQIADPLVGQVCIVCGLTQRQVQCRRFQQVLQEGCNGHGAALSDVKGRLMPDFLNRLLRHFERMRPSVAVPPVPDFLHLHKKVVGAPTFPKLVL